MTFFRPWCLLYQEKLLLSSAFQPHFIPVNNTFSGKLPARAHPPMADSCGINKTAWTGTDPGFLHTKHTAPALLRKAIEGMLSICMQQSLLSFAKSPKRPCQIQTGATIMAYNIDTMSVEGDFLQEIILEARIQRIKQTLKEQMNCTLGKE